MKKQKPKIEKENQEVKSLKNQLARALADYDNLRKRTDEEKLTWIKFATQKLIQNLLPILDTLEAAENHLKDGGLAIAIGQFKDVLKQEGLEEIRPKNGDKFDEKMEEVTDIVESTKENDGKVAELIMPGWKFIEGMVVRHARVKVFKKPLDK